MLAGALAAGVALEDALEDEEMDVRRQLERASEALEEGHRARQAARTQVAESGVPNLAGYAIAQRQPLADLGLVARLKERVLSPASYTEDVILCGGLRSPDVGFHFARGSRRVDILLCFGCGEVFVVGAERPDPGPYEALSSITMNMGQAWLALAKEALPDDHFIQGTTLGP